MGAGLVLESATWRASPDWAELLGLSHDQLLEANRTAIDQLAQLRAGMADEADRRRQRLCRSPW